MKKILSGLLILALTFSFSMAALASDVLESSNDAEIMDECNREEISKKDSIEESNGGLDETDFTLSATTLPSSPSSAKLINSYPSYSLSCNMSNGNAGYLKYKPSYTGNYSAFTTGSLDTYIEVYDSVDLTNMIGYNDDSGHGYNACRYSYLESSKTYYIKVRGYNSSQTGNFTFYFHRGAPMSTYEKPDNISIFNSSTYLRYNNCYCYALNMWKHPLTGSRFRYNGQNPGELSGDPITLSDLSDKETAKAAIVAKCKADAEYYGGVFREIGSGVQASEGFYRVSLVLYPGVDYHWYRQTPNGRYAHKMGSTEAKYGDDSNHYIYVPKPGFADTGNYTEFLGYFEVKCPDMSKLSEITPPEEIQEEKIYELKDNLSIDDFQSISSGTSIDKVKELVGQEHEYIGSGYIGNVYNLEDGQKVAVYFSGGIVDQIRLIEDDSYTIIVE